MADKLKTEIIDTEKIGAHVDELYKFAYDQRRSFERRWYDNNFFDDGFHYRYLQRSTNKIVDLSDKSSMYNPLRAIPKASRQIRGVANLLVSSDPVPVVFPERVAPGSKEAEMIAKDAAKKRSHWLDEEFKAQSVAEKLAFMVILAAKHGVSWLQVWPDSVEEQIKSQVYDAFDIVLFGTLTDPEDSPFMGKGVPKLISQIKADEKFDREAVEKISPDNKRASSEIKEAYMTSRFGREGNPDDATTLILKECFIKEYLNSVNMARIRSQDDGSRILKDKGEGDQVIRQVFVAGNITLRDRYTTLDYYPFIDFRFEPGPIYQVPLIERFIPQNKSLDAAVSRIERFMHTMNVGIYQKRSGEQFKINNAAGGQIIEYDQAPLQQMALTPMPAYVFNFLTYLGGLIEEQGVTTTTLGKLPAGVKGFQAIESLKETEYASLVIAQRRLKRTVQTIAERMLEIADEYFVTPKEIEFLDKGKPSYFQIIGNEALTGRKKLKIDTPENVITIKKDLKVDVEVQSGNAYTKEGKREMAKQLIDTMLQYSQAGLIPPESVKVAFEKWLDEFGFGATSEFMDKWSEALQEGGMAQANMEQIKVAVMEVMKDLVNAGVLPTPEQRMQEIKVANVESLQDVQKATGGAGLGGKQQEQDKGPSRSISFKDLPAEGKVQLAEQAGIQITPEAIEEEKADQMAQAQVSKPKGGQNAGSV